MLRKIRRHIINEFGTHGVDSFLLSLAGDETNWAIAKRFKLSVVQVSFARSRGLGLWAMGKVKKRAKVLPFVYRRVG